MVYHLQGIVDCIPEEILGFGRQLPEGSSGDSKPSPRSCQTDLRSRAWQIVATVERLCSEVAAGELLCIVHYGRQRRPTPYSRKKT